MAKFHTICKMDDVPSGSSKMFVVSEIPIGIFHIDGEFFALDNRCPHAGASLVLGVLDRDTVSCRVHNWHFCVRDGTYLDEDRPEFDARCFPVRLKGDEVQVQI